MAPDQSATQITAAVTDVGVLVLGDGLALSFRERLRVAFTCRSLQALFERHIERESKRIDRSGR